jgi:hypothetical protein
MVSEKQHSSPYAFGYRRFIPRQKWINIFFVVLVVGAIMIYLYIQSFGIFNHFTGRYHTSYMQNVLETFQEEVPVTKIKPKLNYSILKISQKDLLSSLLILQNSIEFFEIPLTTHLRLASTICEFTNRPNIVYNMHSLEFHLPRILEQMSKLADRTSRSNPNLQNLFKLFNLRYENGSSSSSLPSLLKDSPVFQKPLFYYQHSYLYTVVYCSKKRKWKEDWPAGYRYLDEIAPFITQSPEWKLNYGLNFVAAHSHPKSGPRELDPTAINEYIEQTFLRTDMDIRGNLKKDIVVPYTVGITPDVLSIVETQEKIMISDAPRKYFLFFGGGDHPPGGLRAQFTQRINQWKKAQFKPSSSRYKENPPPIVDPNRLIVLLSPPEVYNISTYYHYLINTEFCVTLRGDTTSSVRFFELVAFHCIPVIITDWLFMPFESIIDYNKFSIRFPESILHNIPLMLETLAQITLQQKETYYANLLEARDLLLFTQPPLTFHSSVPSILPTKVTPFIPLLNPITMSFIEIVQKRLTFCDKFHLLEKEHSVFYDSSEFCYNLNQRKKKSLEVIHQHQLERNLQDSRLLF